MTELANMVAKAAAIQEQECKVAVKTRKQVEEADGFSDRARAPQQWLLEIRRSLNYLVQTYT